MLKSFVLRASDDALGPEDLLMSLLTQLANKPPPEWTDADEDRFQVQLAHVARAFHSAESLLVDAGGAGVQQPLLRLAVARRGRPEHERVLPLRATEQPRIEALRNEILDIVNETGSATATDRDQALAALALATESLIGGSSHEEDDE